MSIDYTKLTEITVKSQDELNDIPQSFDGTIYIEFGTTWNRAIVNKKYDGRVVARGNSSVVADGNSQIVDVIGKGRIKISGNARIVYMPKTIEEYCSFYGIKHDKKKGKFFKAVRKTDDGKYVSDRNSEFEYKTGYRAKADRLDTDVNEDCGHGIHIAHLGWCLDYGRDWKDLAILEVEANLDEIILPNGCPGKVRCLEVHVIREVPLEECGVYGKILAKRLQKVEV